MQVAKIGLEAFEGLSLRPVIRVVLEITEPLTLSCHRIYFVDSMSPIHSLTPVACKNRGRISSVSLAVPPKATNAFDA